MPVELTILIIIGLILFYLFIWSTHSDKEKLMKISQYEVNTRATNTFNPEDYNTILTKFIDECFMDYQLLILIPKQELYINETREIEILNDLTMKVSERMSPAFKERLSAYYNPDTLDKVLADKLCIAVANYVLQHNSEK